MGTSIFLKNKSNVIKFQDSNEYIAPANLNENILTSIFIPANSILDNSDLKLYFDAIAVGLNGSKLFNVYFNNVNSLIGATLIATFNTNNLNYMIIKQLWYKNGFIKQFATPSINSNQTIFGNNNSGTTNVNFNFEVDNYLIVSTQLSNILDIVTFRNITMIVTN